MNNKKRTIIVGIALVLASLLLVAFVMQPSAADLLTGALEQMETITDGHAIATFTADTPEQSGSGTVELWGKLNVGPNGEPAFRAEVLDASESELVGATAVFDGYTFWLYSPQENKVLTGNADDIAAIMAEKAANGDFDAYGEYMEEYQDSNWDEMDAEIPETPEEAVAKMLEYFDAERAGREQVGDNQAYKLRLIPIPEQMPDEVRVAGGLLNVWIRTDDKALVGVEYTGGSFGSGLAQATLLELNQGIDDATFTFDIPDGAEVVNVADLEFDHDVVDTADVDAFVPENLPEGATLVDILQMRGAVVQRYNFSDGRSFTIAQGPASAAAGFMPEGQIGSEVSVRGQDGMLYRDDAESSRSLLTWTEGSTTFWVGGDLTADETQQIAESLR